MTHKDESGLVITRDSLGHRRWFQVIDTFNKCSVVAHSFPTHRRAFNHCRNLEPLERTNTGYSRYVIQSYRRETD